MQQTTDPIAQALRTGMRQLASGVSVMTANDPNGVAESSSGADSLEHDSLGLNPSGMAASRVAMTVSSVTSLSDNPASLLVCVNKDTRMSSVLTLGDVFAISVLAKSHEAISTACAVPEVGDSRFMHGVWREEDKSGVLYLADAPAVFFCELVDMHEYGTHKICIGKLLHTKTVVDKSLPPSEEGTEPDLLLYARGAYHYLRS